MTLMRYQPWGNLNRLQHELSHLFEAQASRSPEDTDNASDWSPAVDVKEEDSQFLIHADVPGVNPDDIKVHMENGMLTISGERESEKKDEHEGYKRVERMRGSFLRRFNLPDSADAKGISAKSNHGVLEITIPKHVTEQSRRIKVDH